MSVIYYYYGRYTGAIQSSAESVRHEPDKGITTRSATNRNNVEILSVRTLQYTVYKLPEN